MNIFVKHVLLWIVACSAGIQPALYLDVDCSQILIARFRFLHRLFVVCYYLLYVPYFRPSRIVYANVGRCSASGRSSHRCSYTPSFCSNRASLDVFRNDMCFFRAVNVIFRIL